MRKTIVDASYADGWITAYTCNIKPLCKYKLHSSTTDPHGTHLIVTFMTSESFLHSYWSYDMRTGEYHELEIYMGRDFTLANEEMYAFMDEFLRNTTTDTTIVRQRPVDRTSEPLCGIIRSMFKALGESNAEYAS